MVFFPHLFRPILHFLSSLCWTSSYVPPLIFFPVFFPLFFHSGGAAHGPPSQNSRSFAGPRPTDTLGATRLHVISPLPFFILPICHHLFITADPPLFHFLRFSTKVSQWPTTQWTPPFPRSFYKVFTPYWGSGLFCPPPKTPIERPLCVFNLEPIFSLVHT